MQAPASPQASALQKIRAEIENISSNKQKFELAEKEYLRLKNEQNPMMWDFHSLMVSAASEDENFELVNQLLLELPAGIQLSSTAKYQYLLARARMSQFKGSLENAKQLFTESYAEARELGETAYAVTPVIALAFLNSQQGNHEKVLEYLEILQSLEERAPDKIKAVIYAESAGLYFDSGNYPRAIEYGIKSVQLAEAVGNVADMSAIHANLGLFYASSGDHKSALKHRMRALELSKASANESIMARRRLTVGSSLRALQRTNEALQYLKDLPAIFDKTTSPRYKIESRRELASTLEKMNSDGEALRYYEEALKILSAQEKSVNNDIIMLEILDDMRRIYSKEKNWIRAYEISDRLIALKDAVVESEKSRGMTEFRIKYDTVMKEKENEKLETKAKLSKLALEQERQSTNFYRILAVSLAVFVIILSLLIVFIIRILHQLKAAKELTESQSAEISAILSTIDQGIFTLQGPKLTINQQMSAFAKDQLHVQAGTSFPDFLASHFDISKDDHRIVSSILYGSLDMLNIGFHADSDKLPKELQRSTPEGIFTYEVDWVPMLRKSDNCIEQFLICIRDVTEFRKIQLEMDEYRENVQFLGRLADCGMENFRNYYLTYQSYFKEISTLLDKTEHPIDAAGTLIVFKRHIHTLKGLARALSFLDVSNSCHEIEEALESIGENWDKTLLAKQLTILDSVIGRYVSIAQNKLGWDVNSEKMMVERRALRELSKKLHDSLAKDRLVQDAHKALRKLCYPSLHKTIHQSALGINNIASLLKKPLPILHINGEDLLMSDDVATTLNAVLPHLFRNSLDHGIEAEDTRLAAGKSRAGQIFLTGYANGGFHIITFADDGQGLNLSKIREKALQKGLVTADQVMTVQQWAELIFSPGFSTSDHSSHISGRGVGMDAVRASLLKIGGQIQLVLRNTETQDLVPQAVEFKLTVPAFVEQ